MDAMYVTLPAMLCSQTQSHSRTTPLGVPNVRGREGHTLSHMQRAHVTVSHSTCALTDALTHSMAPTLTCSACSHNMPPHVTHSPTCAHMFAHMFQCTYTLACVHTLTCTQKSAYRPTDSHSYTHVPPQNAHTHPGTDRKRHAGPLRNTASHTHGHLATTHMDRHRKTHTTQEDTCTEKDPHPVSHVDNSQNHDAHKDTQRAPHTGLDAHTDTGTRAHTVTACCSPRPRPPSGR